MLASLNCNVKEINLSQNKLIDDDQKFDLRKSVMVKRNLRLPAMD